MADIMSTVTGFLPSGSLMTFGLIAVVVAIIVLLILGIIMAIIWQKKRYNLKVEIKLPRSDGMIINSEWGIGFYNASRGVVYIKRGGIFSKAIALKIFDPRRYLQGSDTLTVIQLSPIDYRPVLPKSFMEVEVVYKDDKTGKETTVKEAVIQIKADTGADKAWRDSFETSAKKAYSISSFFQQFQTPIAIAIVLIAVFIGFVALWTQLPRVCG